MANKISHDEQLVRAAKIRGWITALLNSRETEPFTLTMIWDALADKFKSVNYNDVALRAMLKSMVDNKLILSDKRANKMFFMSLRFPIQSNKNGADTAQKNKPASTHFSIDIVKSTGKVRITAGDIVIDVGIVAR